MLAAVPSAHPHRVVRDRRSRDAKSLSALALGLTIALACAGAAQAHPNDGEDPVAPTYSLFHPAPRSQMRPLNTDRPDRTESPYTVDAGHWQVEVDAVAYHRDAEAGLEREQWGLAITNAKLGLHDRADLQLVAEIRVRDRVENAASGGASFESESRFGNAIARLKLNLWGGDGGRTAMAVMPFAALRRDAPADFGLIVPYASVLPRGFGFGAMAQAEWEHAGGYHGRWIGSATVGRAIVGELAGFVELWGSRTTVPGERDAVTFDAGLTYGLTPDLRFDTGVNLGVNDAAEDMTAFVGFSVRR